MSSVTSLMIQPPALWLMMMSWLSLSLVSPWTRHWTRAMEPSTTDWAPVIPILKVRLWYLLVSIGFEAPRPVERRKMTIGSPTSGGVAGMPEAR